MVLCHIFLDDLFIIYLFIYLFIYYLFNLFLVESIVPLDDAFFSFMSFLRENPLFQ